MTTSQRWLLALVFVSGAIAACDDDAQNGNPPTMDAAADALDDAAAPSDMASPDTRQFVGVTHCSEDSECDDGRSCTDDLCITHESEGSICQWTLRPGECLINNVCYLNGAPNPADGCQTCTADNATHQWTALEDGSLCDDGGPCTEATVCTGGVCGGGSATSCNDSNSCTQDSCDPVAGCINDPLADTAPCDDGAVCGAPGACDGGFCIAGELDCDDDDPCTDDSCDPVTGDCVHTFNTAPCDDGVVCTVGEVCADGVCGGGQPDTCDDGNECTIDECYEETGCIHLETNNPCCLGATSVCEDNDPCTDDVCDPNTAECTYSLNTAPCDDGNVCTENDTCDQGACNGATRNCDDANDCTDDSCNVSVGCVHTDLDATTCDDGLSCSTGDICSAGLCSADTSGCLCQPTFDDASKIVTLAIGANETAGEALDVDGDGNLDNALAPLGGVINMPLQDAVTGGSLMLLLEFMNLQQGAFELSLLPSGIDPNNAMCDFQTATCDYHANRASLDDLTCDREVLLPADLAGTNVTGGGPTTALPFSIPLDATTSLDITIYMVTIDIDLTLTNGEVVAMDGILGGAVTEDELNSAILSVDPMSLPADPNALIGLIETLAPNDIDTDGDGTDDAKSIGLKLTGIDGHLTGAM